MERLREFVVSHALHSFRYVGTPFGMSEPTVWGDEPSSYAFLTEVRNP